MRRLTRLAVLAFVPALAGCGGQPREQRALRDRTTPAADLARTVGDPLRVHADGPRRLARNGISMRVPPGWSGRILFREPTGASGVIFQAANFELSANDGLEPPPEPPDGRDPIKAMDAGDVLVTVVTDEPDGERGRTRIDLADLTFRRSGDARVPAGHALAEGSVCLGSRCLTIGVDFGGAPPDPRLMERVEELLGSVAVEEPRALELDGLRLELPAAWHGYATSIARDESQPVIWIANGPFAESPARPEFPAKTLRELPPSGVVVEAVAAPSSGPRSGAPFTDANTSHVELPLELADGYFHPDGYEGQQAPHVSTQIVEGRLGSRSFYVQVYFGRNRPSDAMRAAADAVLASFSLEDARRSTRR